MRKPGVVVVSTSGQTKEETYEVGGPGIQPQEAGKAFAQLVANREDYIATIHKQGQPKEKAFLFTLLTEQQSQPRPLPLPLPLHGPVSVKHLPEKRDSTERAEYIDLKTTRHHGHQQDTQLTNTNRPQQEASRIFPPMEQTTQGLRAFLANRGALTK